MRRCQVCGLGLLFIACSSAPDQGARPSSAFPPSDSVTTGPAWDPNGPYARNAHLALIRQGLTALFSSEERYRMETGRYTALIDSVGTERLGVILPPGVSVRVTYASDSGFAAVGIHSEGPRTCVVWTGVVPDSLRPTTSPAGTKSSSDGQLWCDR